MKRVQKKLEAQASVEWWPWIAAVAAAVIAVFVAYDPAMHGPFLLDDTSLPYRNPGMATATLMGWLAGMRPVLMLSYWLDFQAHGENTYGYHVMNVALHLFNGALVFLMARKILGWAQVAQAGVNAWAGFAASLFLLHPLQTESVAYIASRSETLSVFFFYAAFVVFLYRKDVAVSLGTSAAVLVLFGAASMSKEHTVVLPGLLLLTDYFWNPGFSLSGIRKNVKLYVPIALGAMVGAAFVWRVLKGAPTAGFGMKDLTWYQYFFTQCRAIWVYVRFFFLPFGQNIDHDFATSRTVLDQGAIFGLIALVALVAAAWMSRRRFPLGSYGVLVFLLLLAPTSSIVPIKDTLVERRMYLPFIGLLFVVLELARRMKPSKLAMIAVVLVLGVLTYQRNLLWGDTIAIWKDSVEKSPRKVRPAFQLAFGYYNDGRCADAIREFERAAGLATPNYDLLTDWALAYDCVGRPAEAAAKVNQALGLEQNAHAYALLGMIYGKQGRSAEALDALDKAAAVNPGFEMTYVYRGNVYAQQNNWARAAEEYQRALSFNPNNAAAQAALGTAQSQLKR